MESILESLHEMLDFQQSGIYQFFTEAFAYFIKVLTKAAIEWTAFTMVFAWDIAQAIIDDLEISSAVNNAWNSLDNSIVQTLTFFKIPDMINSIISAYVTRYTLTFIPFSGK